MSASIVLYNSPLCMLQRVLESLQQAAAMAVNEGELEAVVVYCVDNASGPGYRASLRKLLDAFAQNKRFRLELQLQEHNRGFGAGHNAALNAASSDYHLVLNPDAQLDPCALARGIAALARDTGIALLSPRVRGPDGQAEFLCKRYPSVLLLALRGFAPALLKRPFAARLAHYEMRRELSADRPCEIDIASGCCMLVRTSHLRAVGGFDEAFFLYFEDFDLSLRLARTGRLMFFPAMQIVHHGGYASRKGWRHIGHFLRSGARFFSRYGWRWL